MNQNESVLCLSHAYHRRTLIWKHWHKNIIAILKTELLVFRTATFLHLFRFRYLGKFWCGIAVFSLYHVRYCGILALPRAVLRYSYPPYDPPPPLLVCGLWHLDTICAVHPTNCVYRWSLLSEYPRFTSCVYRRCCSKYHHAIHDLGLARKVMKECKKTMEDKKPWNGFWKLSFPICNISNMQM